MSLDEKAKKYVLEVLKIPEEDISPTGRGLFNTTIEYGDEKYFYHLFQIDHINEFNKWNDKIRKFNQDKIYLFTFTLCPKKHSKITEELKKQVVNFIESMHERKLNITHLAYVEEEHKSGRPHWHALVVSKQVLKKDRFITFQRKFGFLDISRNKAQKMETVIEYISKTGSSGVKWVLTPDGPEDVILDPSGPAPHKGTNDFQIII